MSENSSGSPKVSRSVERRLFQGALARVRDDGFLLDSDPNLPCLVRLIVGGPVRGSWWGHPAGGTIYRITGMLEEHPDILSVKLVLGKSTSVSRKWWPALLGIATSEAPWQDQGLSFAARRLWKACIAEGEVRVDHVDDLPLARRQKAGDAAREIERRLLAYSHSVHTESGRHVTVLETWEHWTERTGFRDRLLEEELARRKFDDQAQLLYGASNKRRYFPWPSRRSGLE